MDNFNYGESIKAALVESMVDLICDSDCYDKQLCNIQIKINHKDIDVRDIAYAVFPYYTVDLGIPEEDLKEFRLLKDFKGSGLMQKLCDWQYYEYSPPDQTGFIALMHNSKTDNIVFLAKKQLNSY